MAHPILLDETGQVGQRYGAKRTPHMFVIDAKGVLVYRGAIDNSPDGEGESPKDGKLVNYVDAALDRPRRRTPGRRRGNRGLWLQREVLELNDAPRSSVLTHPAAMVRAATPRAISSIGRAADS